jgi:hypothetical protein
MLTPDEEKIKLQAMAVEDGEAQWSLWEECLELLNTVDELRESHRIRGLMRQDAKRTFDEILEMLK